MPSRSSLSSRLAPSDAAKMPPRMVIRRPLWVTWKPSGVADIAASSMLSAFSSPSGYASSMDARLSPDSAIDGSNSE